MPATASTTAAINPDAARVLAFWLEDGLQQGWPSRNLSEKWFRGGDALDQTIAQDFGDCVRSALAGELLTWEERPLDRLALVVVLDQFTRNVFRSQGQAFAGDAHAQTLVLDGITRGWDHQLPLVGKVFFYMPLMHAEDLALQETCVACFKALVDLAPPELRQGLQGNLDFAEQHRDIIECFGRFPYRNAVLGRTSSAEELAFLQGGPRFGQ